MADKLPAIPALAGLPADIQRILSPIKQILEQYSGAAGDGTNAVVTQGNFTGGIDDGDLEIPEGSGGYDPGTDPTPPPTPTGLAANGAFKYIIVDWDPATYRNHAYAEVWRDTADTLDPYHAVDNPTGTTQQVGSAGGSVFTDETASTGNTYYYWIRFVSQASITGPWNAGTGGGTVAQLALIDGSNLSPELFSGNKVTNPDAEGGTAVDWTMDGSGTISATSSDQQSGEYAFDMAGTSTGVVNRAMAIEEVRTYRVGVAVKGKAGGSASGLTIRVIYKNSLPTDGYYLTAADQTGNTVLQSNIAVPAGWTNYSMSFTAPAGAKFASLSIENGATGDSSGLLFDNVGFTGQLVTEHLGANVITAGSGIIGNLAVDEAHIANAAITNAKLDHVGVNKIEIITADIKLANITTALIQDAAIETAKIKDAAIEFAKIGTGEVGTLTVAGDAVTATGTDSLASDTSFVGPLTLNNIPTSTWYNILSVTVNAGSSSSHIPDAFLVTSSAFTLKFVGGSGSNADDIQFECRIARDDGANASRIEPFWGYYLQDDTTSLGPPDFSLHERTSMIVGNGVTKYMGMPALQVSPDNSATGNVTYRLQWRKLAGASSTVTQTIYAQAGCNMYMVGAKR